MRIICKPVFAHKAPRHFVLVIESGSGKAGSTKRDHARKHSLVTFSWRIFMVAAKRALFWMVGYGAAGRADDYFEQLVGGLAEEKKKTNYLRSGQSRRHASDALVYSSAAARYLSIRECRYEVKNEQGLVRCDGHYSELRLGERRAKD